MKIVDSHDRGLKYISRRICRRPSVSLKKLAVTEQENSDVHFAVGCLGHEARIAALGNMLYQLERSSRGRTSGSATAGSV